MMPMTLLKRFNRTQRLYHLFLVVTFLIQSGTGFGRMFITTDFGRSLSSLFGGYETAIRIHFWVGVLMTAGFVVHTIYLISKINWQNPLKSIFGPDSLVPNLQDARHLFQRILWTMGMGSPPKLDRWAYWEKFDYWGVFWGLPLLAVTGIMLKFPLLTTLVLPGWILNILALLHRAEAILAVCFIFLVHFLCPPGRGDQRKTGLDRTTKERGKIRTGDGQTTPPLVQGALFYFRVHCPGFWPVHFSKRNLLRPLHTTALSPE
jgi:cytochrome b subunit of formate dehydrogenase